jgi:hypothetical protein
VKIVNDVGKEARLDALKAGDVFVYEGRIYQVAADTERGINVVAWCFDTWDLQGIGAETRVKHVEAKLVIK